MITFAISTLGCKVNTYESNSYRQGLEEKGYQEVDFKDKADIYIINTCTVTNTAASKSRQKINQALKLNEDAIICVVGCLVQTSSDDILEKSSIDILVGASGKANLVSYIEEALLNKKQTIMIEDVRENATFEMLPLDHFTHQKRAFLKIQDGCNQFCSYCIIPYARGKERSMNPDLVVLQAKALVKQGHQELVLSGIHTGRYGKEHACSLTDLMYKLIEVEGLKRIRISSIEMNEVTDRLLDLMENNDKIAKHLHIPLQSGSDTILKNMNRQYLTAAYYERLIEIRNRIPKIAITADVIVGFPQEDDSLFLETVSFIEKSQFTSLHVFPYSMRKNTIAATLKPQIENSVKKQRVHKLMEISNNQFVNYKQTFVNKTVSVLVEQKKNGYYFGHSSEYLPVYIEEEATIGEIVDVKISRFQNNELYGKVDVE